MKRSKKIIFDPCTDENWGKEHGNDPVLSLYSIKQRRLYYRCLFSELERIREAIDIEEFIEALNRQQGVMTIKFADGTERSEPTIINQCRAIDPKDSLVKKYEKSMCRLRELSGKLPKREGAFIRMGRRVKQLFAPQVV